MEREKTCSEEERKEVVTIRLFERDKSIILRSLTEANKETKVVKFYVKNQNPLQFCNNRCCSSADVQEDSIIEFGVHWIVTTSSAVYEEKEREEINSGEILFLFLFSVNEIFLTGLRNLSDLRNFFHIIYTFLNK